jgi:C-terminal processing protease CtpA/Prc
VQYFADGTRFYDEFVVPRPVPEHVFTGELFVLIDGGCFSSTGHLSALLKYHGAGIFIGVETGGSFACNDASEGYTLKHTGLRIGLPRMTFRVATRGLAKGRGILPDHEIEPTIDDLISGRDVVREKAVSLIGTTERHGKNL